MTYFAPVQQTQTINLSFKLGSCTIAATSHIEERGKKSEIVKYFLQHVTPVTESETCKPGQEQQTTKRNSSERINMILKIAKSSKANELTAEASSSMRDKGEEILNTYRRLQKK